MRFSKCGRPSIVVSLKLTEISNHGVSKITDRTLDVVFSRFG